VNINPVQIQGLDMQPIYQLLQWLVKKLLESRDERNTINKEVAKDYFKVNFGIRKENLNKKTSDDMYTHTKYNYINTGRLFRQAQQNADIAYNDPLRVYYTLVEYGMNKDLSFQRTMIDLLKKKGVLEESIKSESIEKPIVKEASIAPQQALSTEEKNKLDEVLFTNVTEVKAANKVNTNIIEEIFSENVDMIIKEIDK
jgi:hypothetical protein